MKIQKTKLDGQHDTWLVVGDNFLPIPEIQEFIGYLVNIEKSPHTLRAYAHHLKLYWEFLNAVQKSWQQIGLNDLADFVHCLRSNSNNVITLHEAAAKRCESTVNTILAAVSSFYHFHYQMGNTSMNLSQFASGNHRRYKSLLHHVAKHYPTTKRIIKLKVAKAFPKTLKSAQVQALLVACISRRDQFLILLLYETGMRIGQALGLRHEDIHSWDNEIHIVPRSHEPLDRRGKTVKGNIIHVTPTLMQHYSEYMCGECEGLESLYVFIQLSGKGRGQPLTYRAVRALFARLSHKVGFHINAHMLRHTHATELIQAGWDSAYVQKRLGHAHVQTTLDIYAHLQPEDLKRVFKAYQDKKQLGEVK